VIQAPCNSSGSKSESGISYQFGFNFDFVAQQQATATRKSDLGALRRVFPKRVAPAAVVVHCGNHTQELAQANHGASKRQSTKENCTCAFVCLTPSDFWISRQRQGRIEVFPQTRRSTEQHTLFFLNVIKTLKSTN